jgi:hypothetical protein
MAPNPFLADAGASGAHLGLRFVEDALGVDIELNQRSEGLQWCRRSR